MKRLILLLFLTVGVTNSYACRCDMYVSLETFMEERFAAADFVIAVKVEFVRDSVTKGDYVMSSDPTYWREGGYNPVLKVGKVYKGELKTSSIEITPRWSNCSQYFKIGDTYIIFGYLDKEGQYTTNVCSGNFSTEKIDKMKTFKKISRK